MRMEKYLNCHLHGAKENTQGFDGAGYCVAVYPDDGSLSPEMLFYESTYMSGQTISIRHGSRQSETEALEELENIAFSTARARIALKLYDIGKTYKQNIDSSSEQEKSGIDDEDIKIQILRALLRIRKKFYQTYKSMNIDVDGFCYLLKTSKDQFIFNADIMFEDGLVDTGDVEELYVENGGINITSKGIRYLSQVPDDVKKILHSETNKELSKNNDSKYKYDVAISFAGSDRKKAEKLATIIRDAGYEVFYDKFYEDDLWGEDLSVKFEEVFRNESRYCVVFISEEYSKRMWTKFEIRNAIARAIEERGNAYILPIKVDDTDIPGLPPMIAYLSLKELTIEEISEKLFSKIKANN